MAYASTLPHTGRVNTSMWHFRGGEKKAKSKRHMAMNKVSKISVAAGSQRRKGAVIVELSFTLVPFLAMMFAIAEFAMPIFLHSTFNAAVREGVRFGVTYNTSYNGANYSTQTDAIRAVVQANSLGFLQGSTSSAQ